MHVNAALLGFATPVALPLSIASKSFGRPRKTSLSKRRALAWACLSIQPTHHRAIISTPLHTAADILPALLVHGVRPITLPILYYSPLSQSQHIDQVEDTLLRLQNFDLIIFPTAPSISCFSAHLASLVDNNLEAALIALQAADVQLATLPQYARLMKQTLKQPPNIIPMCSTLNEFPAFIAADDRLEGAKVLCLQPMYADMQKPKAFDKFVDALRNSAFQVTSLHVYHLKPRCIDAVRLELQLIDQVDAFLFCSEPEVYALRQVLDQQDNASLREQVEKRFADPSFCVATVGHYTAEAVHQLFGIRAMPHESQLDFSNFAQEFVIEINARTADGRLILPT